MGMKATVSSLLLTGTFLAVLTPTAFAGVPVPIDSSYKLVFDEEFNGSGLDAKKWTSGFWGTPGLAPPANSNEDEAYDPSLATVSGGYLHLNLVNESASVNGANYRYRSGAISTYGKYSQAYGYFEARVYLPGSNGKIYNWPAFWLTGLGKWPVTGELDVLEGMDGIATATFHDPSGAPSVQAIGDYTGWHVFAALWSPGKVTAYYDGKEIGTLTKGITASPQMIILNLATGGCCSGEQVVPSEMLVDYVHAYSNAAGAVAVTPQAGYGGPGDTGSGASIPAPVVPVPVAPPVASAPVSIQNAGFESGLSGWNSYGNVAIVKNAVHSGSNALRLGGGQAGAQQVVQLKANTSYTLSAYVRYVRGQPIAIGVKNYGGAQVSVSSKATSYSKVSVTFKTGASNTSAIIFLYEAAGVGSGDDFQLTPN